MSIRRFGNILMGKRFPESAEQQFNAMLEAYTVLEMARGMNEDWRKLKSYSAVALPLWAVLATTGVFTISVLGTALVYTIAVVGTTTLTVIIGMSVDHTAYPPHSKPSQRERRKLRVVDRLIGGLKFLLLPLALASFKGMLVYDARQRKRFRVSANGKEFTLQEITADPRYHTLELLVSLDAAYGEVSCRKARAADGMAYAIVKGLGLDSESRRLAEIWEVVNLLASSLNEHPIGQGDPADRDAWQSKVIDLREELETLVREQLNGQLPALID